MQTLQIVQVKKLRVMVDEEISKCNLRIQVLEQDRLTNLREIGNILHDSVPVSNDEVSSVDMFSKLFSDSWKVVALPIFYCVSKTRCCRICSLQSS